MLSSESLIYKLFAFCSSSLSKAQEEDMGGKEHIIALG